jgi:hypothetical protein
MIKYALLCQEGHEFEAWFKNGATYEAQVARARVSCPRCGSHAVEKAIMAPAVAKRASRDTPAQQPSVPVHELQRYLRKIRDEVHAKAEYVGGRFAEEARKIHFDEGPARGIYGQASAEEVKALADDGIPFLPMPQLPEDLN